MRKRILVGAIAAFVFIVGVVSIVAIGSSSSYDPETATVAASGPNPPSINDAGRQVENLADWTATVQFVQMANFVTFAETYQAHLDAEAVAAAARQKAAVPAQKAPAAPRTEAPAQSYSGPSSSAGGSVWDRIAQCESGGNWAINTGNGFSGGVQFAASSWRGFGGTEFAPMAYQASREQQIIVAERILASQGYGAWPACSAKLGLR